MKEHKGMRPQDVVVLLKLVIDAEQDVRIKNLAAKLFISSSEISESINRSSIAQLIDPATRLVNKEVFLLFLEHGLPYVFPAQLGAVTKGYFSAHSESSLYLSFSSEEKLVWPDPTGKEKGSSLQPLYPNVTKAIINDRVLHKLLALCDIIRVGGSADKSKAVWQIREIFYARGPV